MRIAYLSQVMSHDDPRRDTLPDEKIVTRPLFVELGVEADVIDVTHEALPDASDYAGIVVGGSAGSVHDDEPWRGRLQEWMAANLERPLLGLCGGHQLVAKILGARVEAMAKPQVGVWPLQLPDVPGFEGWVIQMHTEAVVEVPPGATVWAEDEFGIQALRYSGWRWTVQFHPEIGEAVAYKAGRGLGATEASWPEREVKAAVAGGKALIGCWLDGLR